jgi:hypothetical protein
LWLEGAHEGTEDFHRRVILAESAFMALCEALLRLYPDRGVPLWHALRHTLTTRIIGKAKIDDMIHMAFRAPDSPAVANLRAELMSLNFCRTDKDLFDLALAANLNGHSEWLNAAIAQDVASPFAWRRKRAVVLEGFTTNNALPQHQAWPDAPLRTDFDQMRNRSARFRYAEACAHHWWLSYLAAPDAEAAYAAWILFARAADRRAWVWLRRDADAAKSSDQFSEKKITHALLNRDDLIRTMDKREEKLEKTFLGREIKDGIGPWGKIAD